MPELPEVECLTRAVQGVLQGRSITKAVFHREDLRWPIPIEDFQQNLVGTKVLSVRRRSKYMLIETERGVGIFHLGMSGNMLLSDSAEPKWKHTHASFQISGATGARNYLHFVDPRRFGCILACSKDEFKTHPLLTELGPEPLDNDDLAEHLWQKSRGKTVVVKTFLMDAHVVVGVGNIYANESLFRAGIRPTRAASKVTREEWNRLAEAIKAVLTEAISAGGTSFRDYKHADGEPGYFELALKVYGREAEPCLTCQAAVKHKRISGRATFYCPRCQR